MCVVFEIKTLGHGSGWIKFYQVSYSSDAVSFDLFKENGAVKVGSYCYIFIIALLFLLLLSSSRVLSNTTW